MPVAVKTTRGLGSYKAVSMERSNISLVITIMTNPFRKILTVFGISQVAQHLGGS